LIKDDVRTTNRRVPVLGSIPVLGHLFRSQTSDKVKTNLLIFITPRIVQPGKTNLTDAQKLTLEAIENPKRYGFLHDRRKMINEVYGEAKKNYTEKNYEAARAQFMEVMSLNPDHEGAMQYLRKMNALPQEKPIG
jgi:general secretion pathway protein D